MSRLFSGMIKTSHEQIQRTPGPTRSAVIADFQPKQITLEPLVGEWAVAGRFGRVNEGCPQERAAELWLESESESMAERNLAHFRDFKMGADESPDWNV